jgi:RND family efflux transporter MFP subunit
MIKLDKASVLGGAAVAAAVLLVAGLGFGLQQWFSAGDDKAVAATAEAEKPQDESELPAVSATAVKTTKIAPQATYPGSVVSQNDSKLAADMEGRVTWVAEVGAVVKAGDVVARLDNNLAAMQNEADKANVARLSAVLKYDRAHADRMQELRERKVMSQAAADQAASTRDSNEAALKQAQAALKRSQYQLEHAEIRAPFGGRVVARLINAGEYASAGKDVVRLVDLSAIEISTQVPIAAMQYVREGMKITADVQGKPVETAVRVIVPVGDSQSRTVEVRLSLDADAAFVGDAAKVMIPSAEARMVLAVPRDALVLREENTYIFKLGKENKAERIAVEIGAKDGELVEVTGMLREGERVIVRGAERLESGQKVRLVSGVMSSKSAS